MKPSDVVMNFFTNNYLILLFLGISISLNAQIEEIDPVNEGEIEETMEIDPSIEIETTEPLEEVEVSTTDEDYKDTWRTPYVDDDMTADPEQNKAWRMGEYKYNSRPKNSWEVGLHGGHFFIDGDVDRRIPGGWGAGLHLRKAVNYMFSLRASAFYGRALGHENQPWRHQSIGGGLVENVFDSYDVNSGGSGYWFPSHRTTYIAADLAIVLNIGNLLFHKERNKWNWYAALGIGLDHHEVKLDLLDGSVPYDDLLNRSGFSAELFDTKAGRDEIESNLDEIYDGIYETDGFKKKGIFRVGDDFNIHAIFVPSMGISRKITKRINIALEHQIFLSDNDYLDGIKWRTAVDQTNNVDIGHYTHLRIGLNIGNFDKVTEPLYWLNPYDATFSDVADLKSQPALDLTDEDGDGVLDIIDQELDTPEDCPVDTRGVLLDSDGDGIVDCEDKEPYSRPGCPIDELGVAQCEEECCADEESINELIDAKAEEFRASSSSMNYTSGSGATTSGGVTTAGGGVTTRTVERVVTNPDGTTRTETVVVPSTVTNTVTRSGCGEWFLPMIHYDLNKSRIKPEYYSHLHHVAQVLEQCPEVCVVAQGHTDSRNSNDYNTVLSYKRAKEAVDYLVDNYGIDRYRLKLMYGGEENPMVQSPTSESHHFMNRRVEFRTCRGSDFDMEAPAGYNAVQSAGSSSGTSKPEYYNGNKSSGY